MPSYIPFAILIFCFPVIFLPSNRIQTIFWITGLALVVGTLGYSWPYIMPVNFLTDHSWAVDSPLHPQLATFWGGICLLFGVGLILSLACRALLLYFGIIKKR